MNVRTVENYSEVTFMENCSKKWWFILLNVHVVYATGENLLNVDTSGAQSIYGSNVNNRTFL